VLPGAVNVDYVLALLIVQVPEVAVLIKKDLRTGRRVSSGVATHKTNGRCADRPKLARLEAVGTESRVRCNSRIEIAPLWIQLACRVKDRVRIVGKAAPQDVPDELGDPVPAREHGA